MENNNIPVEEILNAAKESRIPENDIKDIEEYTDIEKVTVEQDISNDMHHVIGSINGSNISDEDCVSFLSCINKMKTDPTYKIFKDLPVNMQEYVKDFAKNNNYGIEYWEAIARQIVNEFVSEYDKNNDDLSIIDLDKELNKLTKIPSISDLYSDHIRSVMNTNLPELINNIKETEPEKANNLERVRSGYNDSCSLIRLKEAYDTNSRIRKALRRNSVEFKRSLDCFNAINDRSNFKMMDIKELPISLNKILITDVEETINYYTLLNYEVPEEFIKIKKLNITSNDIQKFCILLCMSCEDLNPEDVIDASYMYYLTKNIIMLKYTQEAKTESSSELINNICNLIIYIRNMEDEFYVNSRK